jgi:cullin 3
MQSSLTRSFSDFINSTEFNRASEYISLYIDDNMRKHVKTMTEDEVDLVLQRAITLLKYIQDKDMFERYYKKHLSRRLLMDKSASLEIEKQMVGRMKIELGNTFTSKMEGMFKDMTISEELTGNYRDYISAKQGADPRRIDLKIQVLTSMTWPTEMMERISNDPDRGSQIPKINFPPEIEKLKSSFENFYSHKHSGRRLTWLPQAGNADIKARLPSKKAGKEFQTFEYNVSTYAMVVLLLFNDLKRDESLTFDEIQARTNIPEQELIRNLQSLAVAPATRILRKEPMSRDVKPNDKFFYNESFTPRAVRIRVGVVAAGSKVETDRERIETEKRNDGSRQFVIEAAIVRIMKYVHQHTTLEHDSLTC